MLEDPCIPLSSMVLIGAWIVVLFVAFTMILVTGRRWGNMPEDESESDR